MHRNRQCGANKALVWSTIFLLLLLLIPGMAQAEEKFTAKSDDTVDIYIAMGLPLLIRGESDYYNNDDPNLSSIWKSPIEKDSLFLSVRAGVTIPDTKKMLAVELEYNYFRASYDYTEVLQQGNKLSPQGVDLPPVKYGKLGGYFLFINMLLRHPTGRIHPYLGAGIGTLRLQQSELFDDLTRRMKTITSTFDRPYQLFAGVDFDLTPEWSLGLRYKRIYFDTTSGVVNKRDFLFKTLFFEIKRTW